jgi:hypothetical protein
VRGFGPNGKRAGSSDGWDLRVFVAYHHKNLTNAQFLNSQFLSESAVALHGCVPSDRNWEFRN